MSRSLRKAQRRLILQQLVRHGDRPVRPLGLPKKQENTPRAAIEIDSGQPLRRRQRSGVFGKKGHARSLHREHVADFVQRVDDRETLLGLHARAHVDRLGAHFTRGPAARTSGETVGANWAKFSSKLRASVVATRSYSAGSDHVRRGWSTSLGTPGHAVGTPRPKIGSGAAGTLASEPSSAAATIARVCAIGMRWPTPYGPPLHPVLTSHTS